MVILLGEIVISVGNAALTQPTDPTTEAARWLALGGGLVLAGTLWWLYFTSSADINQRILTASGGNPALAYTIYATGHLLPAFALLAIAAGINLSLHPHHPHQHSGCSPGAWPPSWSPPAPSPDYPDAGTPSC